MFCGRIIINLYPLQDTTVNTLLSKQLSIKLSAKFQLLRSNSYCFSALLFSALSFSALRRNILALSLSYFRCSRIGAWDQPTLSGIQNNDLSIWEILKNRCYSGKFCFETQVFLVRNLICVNIFGCGIQFLK